MNRPSLRTLVRRPGFRWALVALGVYTLTTCLMFYPVPFHLDEVIVGSERGDAYQYTWSLWWAGRAILEPGKGLTHLTLMNHPVGLVHPFMLTLIGVHLTALPFSLLLSPAVAYNLQVLLSFVLSGMAMYWLCSEWTGDRRAGLVGGFILAFFLNKTGHVLGGHLPQVSIYWVPLYALFLRRLVCGPGWAAALGTALTLTGASLIHVMHLVYLVLPVTGAVLLAGVVEMRREFITRRRLGMLALAFGLAALATAPFLLPTARSALGESSYLHQEGILPSSTDLLAFFTPSPYHPLLRPLGWLPPFADRVFPSPDALREGLAYPGLLTAALAVWGLVKRRRRAWVWAALALTAAVLSLGPLLKVGGELALYRVDGEQSHVVLPYALLKQLPILDVGRTPGRLNEAVAFAVAVLAAYGAAELSGRLACRPRLRGALLALALLGIGFESVAVWPFPTGSAEIPLTIQRIAADPRDGALLHLGMTRREVNHRALYYQTVTGRPCVGGRVHRDLPETGPWWASLSGLAQADPAPSDIIPRPDKADRRAWLRHLGVDYVILHRDTWEWQHPAYRGAVEALLGPPRYEDPALSAFPVPENVAELESDLLYTLSVEGWHGPEWDGDRWRRWMCDDGQLYLYAARAESGSLGLVVDAPQPPAVLEVYRGEEGQERLDGWLVGERVMYATRPITLTQGMNVFRFHAPGGGRVVVDDPACWRETLLTPPEDGEPRPCDPQAVPVTCRTFVFDRISFMPRRDMPPGMGLDVNLGDVLRLRGWEMEGAVWRPGSTLTVTLTWEPLVALGEEYVAFVHLLGPDGELVAQHDGPLAHGQTASDWPVGVARRASVAIQLPPDLPPDDYRLVAGVYLWPSLERLPVLADGPEAERGLVALGDVTIAP